MSNKDNKKPSLMEKLREAGSAVLDAQIQKAKSSIKMNQDLLKEDFIHAKAVVEDPTQSIHSGGYKDKPHRLRNSHLKQMAYKDSIIAAVIQTRKNQVAAHSKLVKSEREKGWMLKIRDEEALLEQIKEELREKATLNKSEEIKDFGEGETQEDVEKDQKTDDQVEEYNWELERKAREKLQEKYKAAKKKAQDYLLNCGIEENRPFETKKWNFESYLRAITGDSLTYDLYATEIVPAMDNTPHHFFPIDGATVKYASAQLHHYKQNAENLMGINILHPEKELRKIKDQKVLELDQDLLEENQYKWVQVVKGNIERAFTPDELKVGIRNNTTDIYNNGYGVSELELIVALVTAHLNAEFYNQSYFTQGFSAKGILHIKSTMDRRKLETVRQQWQHMIKGSRNFFQTPIFAGMDDVSWIPLTQNHNDIGFDGWMRYLLRMICAVYQIDPAEAGFALKDEGSSGMSGDNTKEKLQESKDKGLSPLIRHIENYINESILKPFDDRFVLHFTGVGNESADQAIERVKKLSEFALTVNEVREELGKPPLPGMDTFILNQTYWSYYQKFSREAVEMAEMGKIDSELGQVSENGIAEQNKLNSSISGKESEAIQMDRDLEAEERKAIQADSKVQKSLKIEYIDLEE